jgi:Mor family transcriptional regulator
MKIHKHKVIDLYQKGSSPNEIAVKLECSVSGVYRVLRYTDCYLPTNRRRFDSRTEIRIVKLYQHGKSLEELGIDFKCNNRTIRNVLLRNNCEVRKQGAPCKGRLTAIAGYIYIGLPPTDKFFCMLNSSGYVAEHRYVMAKHLNRPLEKHETIHHIDGERANNRIENLQLRSGKHGKGVVHVCRKCGSKDIKTIELSA